MELSFKESDTLEGEEAKYSIDFKTKHPNEQVLHTNSIQWT